MSNFDIKLVREGLRNCLITRECTKCPYYIWFYNDDITEPGDRSCWGILYRDADLALQRFSILNDSGVN